MVGMRAGSIAKSLRMVKRNITQLKRTKRELIKEEYREEASVVDEAIHILQNILG